MAGAMRNQPQAGNTKMVAQWVGRSRSVIFVVVQTNGCATTTSQPTWMAQMFLMDVLHFWCQNDNVHVSLCCDSGSFLCTSNASMHARRTCYTSKLLAQPHVEEGRIQKFPSLTGFDLCRRKHWLIHRRSVFDNNY